MDLVIQSAVALAVVLVAWIAVRWLLGRGRLGQLIDDESRATVSRSLLALFLVIAVVLVLSGRNETIRDDLVLGVLRFLPRLVVGVVILVVTGVMARLVGVLVGQALRSRSPVLATRLSSALTALVYVVGILLALKQMGIETDVVALILAAVLGAGALATGLGIGFGVVPLARQVAAGRHVEDRFTVGQRVRLASIDGRIQSVSLASVQVIDEAGIRWEIPHFQFLEEAVAIVDD